MWINGPDKTNVQRVGKPHIIDIMSKPFDQARIFSSLDSLPDIFGCWHIRLLSWNLCVGLGSLAFKSKTKNQRPKTKDQRPIQPAAFLAAYSTASIMC